MRRMLRPGSSLLAAFAILCLCSAATQAAPISMSPDPVTLDGINGTFTLSLASGDSSSNALVFDLKGSNPPGALPAAGLAAIVFDGASILFASELADPDGLIQGLALPSAGAVAGLLLDFGPASQASFRVILSAAPTTATIYSLGLSKVTSLYGSQTWKELAIEKRSVRFETTGYETSAIPEPGAALCFAAGLALVASRRRRRA